MTFISKKIILVKKKKVIDSRKIIAVKISSFTVYSNIAPVTIPGLDHVEALNSLYSPATTRMMTNAPLIVF